MALREDEINPPDSSSVLASGSFKARDEARRQESLQRKKLQMEERIDRNLNRAIRKGDTRQIEAFSRLRGTFAGGGSVAGGGIPNRDDIDQRVKDGVIKGAEARWEMGQVGKTGENGLIAGAPPEDSVTPKQREAVNPSATAGAGRGTPIKQPEGPAESPQRPVVAVAPAQGGVQNESVAPSAKLTPEALKSRQAFAADLDRSTLVKSDPAARERAYKRGEDIGVSRELVDRRMGWDKAPVRDFAYEAPKGQEFQKVDGSGRVNESEAVALARKIQGNNTMTPEAKARSEKEAAVIARGRESAREAGIALDAADYRKAERETRWAADEQALAAESSKRGEYIGQVAKDRDVWFEDVEKNAAYARSFLGVPAAFTGQRIDEPMPAVDWDAFESRKTDDPNLGGKRYKSQYESNTTPEVPYSPFSPARPSRTTSTYRGKTVDSSKLGKVSALVGGVGVLSSAAFKHNTWPLKKAAEALEYSVRSLDFPPLIPFPR